MSFGFSVGDFLAVINLATQIRKQFSDAPKHFRDLSDDVRSLSVTLFDLAGEDDGFLHVLGPNETEHLRTILEASHHVLKDLEGLLTKYNTLDPGPRSQRKQHVRRLWDRLTFDCEELRDVRRRLSSNVSILGLFLSNCNEKKLGKSLNKLETYADQEERQRVLDWIKDGTDKHVKQFQYLVRHREPNTRRWLFESPEWRTWTRTDSKAATLLCPGIPGAGKTYTSAMVIEQLHSLLQSDHEDIGVGYFFCNYKEYDHDEVSVAKTLLGMLLGQLHHLPSAVIKASQTHRQCGTELSDPDEVFDALMTCLKLKSNNFLVIDALDEIHASARRPLVSRLINLQRNAPVNLFVTSRDLGNFEDLFPGVTRITIQATDHDIQQYLSTHMRSLPLCVRKDPALQNDIKVAIVQAAGEIYHTKSPLTTVFYKFLLAELHLRSLMNVRPSQKAVREALKALKTGPSATTDAFETAMRRINDQPKETSLMAMRTLLLLTYARRPLTVDELCHALAVEADEHEEQFDPDNVPEMEDVLPSCAGLVVVQSRHDSPESSTTTSLETRPCLILESLNGLSLSSDGNMPGYTDGAIVQLVHKSFQDYLSLTKSQWFPRAESIMATICRAYMSACEDIESTTDRHFLDYAKSRWGYHHLKAEADSKTTDMDPHSKSSDHGNDSLPNDKKTLSVEFGIRQRSKELGGMRELLFWACTEGRINLVEILLTTNLATYTQQIGRHSEKHASQQANTRIIDYAFSYSVTKNGNQAVVECLLAHGASLQRRLQFPKEYSRGSFTGCTALEHAVGAGLTDTLRFLLGHPSIDAMLVEMKKCPARMGTRMEEISVPFQYENTIKQSPFPWLASPLPTLIWDSTPLFVAVKRDQDSCLDIILDWMRSNGHQESDETWLRPLQRAMLLGLRRGSVKTLAKLSSLIGVHGHLNDSDPESNPEKISSRQIALALNSKYPLRMLLAREGVDVPQPDPCDANAVSMCTGLPYTMIVQNLLSSNMDVQPELLVESLFRGNKTDVTLISNRLCSSLDNESPTRLDILYEIFLSALHQQMRLHAKRWKRSDYLATGSGDPTLEELDAFDLVWDTSVLDRQRSSLEWDFVDLILPSMTNSDDLKNTPSSIHHGEDANVPPEKESAIGLQTLFLAIALRERCLVEKLIRCEPSLIGKADAKGRTGLMAAVCTRSEDVTRFLLESLDNGSTVSIINAKSDAGYSAVAYAVRIHDADQVLRLLKTPNFDLWSVFDEVVDGGYPFVWALDMMGDNPICDHICKSLLPHPNVGRLNQALQQLQKLPQRLYLGDDRYRGLHESWKTLLCYTVIHRRLETFKFLLETGSDFEAADGRGRTPLSHAEESRLVCDQSKIMVDMLLARGADHLRLDQSRRFPLWYALNSHPVSTVVYDNFDQPGGLCWEQGQLQRLYVDRPQFLSEAGVGNALFDFAVTRCALTVLKFLIKDFLIRGSDSNLQLECVGSSGFTPLAKMMLSLNVVLPVKDSEDDDLDDVSTKLPIWCSKVKDFYTLLKQLQISQGIPDKDGKTVLCHALDRLYSEHCGNSSHRSPKESHYSDALSSVLLFIIEDQYNQVGSNPLLRNQEGYCPLDLAHALLEQLEREADSKSEQEIGKRNLRCSSPVSQNLLSDFWKMIDSSKNQSDAWELAVETASESFDGAMDLLNALDDEESFHVLKCRDREEEAMTLMTGKTKMEAAIEALNVKWRV